MTARLNKNGLLFQFYVIINKATHEFVITFVLVSFVSFVMKILKYWRYFFSKDK